MPSLLHSQVYLRILEGKDLKGVEANGTSDPYFQIYVDGEKRGKESKRIPKTLAPQWHQEYVLMVPKANSKIEIKVSDWNRFASNVSLGTATIKLEEIVVNTLHDLWLPLDNVGGIHVMILVSPFPEAHPGSVSAVRLPQTRLQLENTAYYPGSTLRGAVVFGVMTPTKVKGIRLVLDGRQRTWTSTGDKNKVHWFATHIFFNGTAALLGNLEKTEIVELQPGGHIFPFEYVLPMNLAPTWKLPYHQLKTRYTVTAEVDIVGKTDKKMSTEIRVLSPWNMLRMDTVDTTITKLDGVLASKQEVIVHVNGPAIAFIGEMYTFNVRIENNGNKSVDSLTPHLGKKAWIAGKREGQGGWHRPLVYQGQFQHQGWSKVTQWKVSGLTGLPVRPGTAWEGQVSVKMPSDGLAPSQHSTFSPLSQNAYRIKLKLATSGTVSKSEGKTKMLIAIADRNSKYEHLPMPLEPEGPVGQLLTCPVNAQICAALAPPLDDGHDSASGRPFGSIAGTPGATVLPLTVEKKAKFTNKSILTSEDWMPGTVPGWVREEGINPLAP